jgi:hypothetical protein
VIDGFPHRSGRFNNGYWLPDLLYFQQQQLGWRQQVIIVPRLELARGPLSSI